MIRNWKAGDVYSHGGKIYMLLATEDSVVITNLKDSAEYPVTMAASKWHREEAAIFLINIAENIAGAVESAKRILVKGRKYDY